MTVPSLAGRSILIIEDEALIAFDLAQAFEAAGADVTSTSSLHHAAVLVRHDGLSAAVVDHVLPDGDTHEICRFFQERSVPFVVYSGCNSDVLLDGFKAVFISKPNTPELVVAAVEGLLQVGPSFATSLAPKENVGERV